MQLNGAFSTLSGLVFVAFSQQLAAFQGLGAGAAAQITETGIGLLGFAAFLFASARFLREKRVPLLLTGAIAVTMDILWVASSAYTIAAGVPSMNLAGKWMTVILAVFVLDFAVFQFLGLKRVREAGPETREQRLANPNI
jgi:hypothetical protein